MPTVELVYDGDCPNVANARAQLVRAFAAANVQPRWQEWRGDDPASPAHVRGYGSPTILVDGADVAEDEASDAACCRLYGQPDGTMQGVPSLETLTSALLREQSGGVRRARRPGRGFAVEQLAAKSASDEPPSCSSGHQPTTQPSPGGQP